MSAFPIHLLLAGAAALVVALGARRARALSASGAIAAAVVGFLLFGLGGGRGALALLLFFVSSSALSRWRRREKERFDWEKGGERDAGQVLANGGVAALAALLLPLFPDARPEAALLGALAAANADTWATEIGALSRVPPRLITTLRPAPPGASGAVSLLGTTAALAGALAVAAVALVWRTGFAGFLAAGAGGFIGALVDSLLGATLQARFRCPVCGRLTERRVHCGEQPATRERGLAFLGNDAVNFLATLAGAAVASALFALFR